MSKPSTARRVSAYVLAIALPLALSGCGEAHPSVTGKVTLDGSPLADAIVSFMPENEEGIPAFGRTDREGHYTLHESSEAGGAVVGKYTVRISTFREGQPDADPPIPPVKEKVPPRYNVETELAVEVKEGENVFDFDLESGK